MNHPTPNPFGLAYLRQMREKTQQIAENFNTAGVGFILTELDTAITFCDVALASNDPAHAQRDAEQAQRAIDTVARLKGRVRLNEDDEKQIAEKACRENSRSRRSRLIF